MMSSFWSFFTSIYLPPTKTLIVAVCLLHSDLIVVSAHDGRLLQPGMTEPTVPSFVRNAKFSSDEYDFDEQQYSNQMPTRNVLPSLKTADSIPQTSAQGNTIAHGTTLVQTGRSESARPDVVSAGFTRIILAQNESRSSANNPARADASPAQAAGSSDSKVSSPGTTNSSATEKLKQLLAERRQALRESLDSPEGETVLDSSDDDPAGSFPAAVAPASKLEGLNDLSADLFSDDPFKRDRAQQYERVKLQLLQLKARLRASRDGTTEPLPEASADTTGGQQQKVPPSKIEFFPATETTADSTNNSDPDAAPPMESADPDLASSSEDSLETVPEADSDDVANEDSTAESMTQSGELNLNRVKSAPSIVEGAIDRLGLANNLYAVGDYAVALEIYSHPDSSALTPQQKFWVDYQAANCLRRMGQHGEASNRYRRIAGNSDAGWLSEKARWWVIVLEKVRQAEKDIADDPSEEALLRTVPTGTSRGETSQRRDRPTGLIERPASTPKE